MPTMPETSTCGPALTAWLKSGELGAFAVVMICRGMAAPPCSHRIDAIQQDRRFCLAGARRGQPAFSLNVELVALGVEHGDAVFAVLRARGHNRGTGCGQPSDRLIDPWAPLGWRRAGWTAGVDVEVETVLDRLGLGNPLEVNPGPGAVRIDDRACVVPAFFRDAVLAQEGQPIVARLGWALQLVAERIGPESGHDGRIGAVEYDLDRDRHATSLGQARVRPRPSGRMPRRRSRSTP